MLIGGNLQGWYCVCSDQTCAAQRASSMDSGMNTAERRDPCAQNDNRHYISCCIPVNTVLFFTNVTQPKVIKTVTQSRHNDSHLTFFTLSMVFCISSLCCLSSSPIVWRICSYPRVTERQRLTSPRLYDLCTCLRYSNYYIKNYEDCTFFV